MTTPVRMPIHGPQLVDDGALSLPVATLLPGPGEARVHGSGARWLRTFALALVSAVLVAACMTVGILLHRIDAAEQWAHVARSEARLARAEARRSAIIHRDLKPANDPRVEVLERRTTALRGAILVLVRTGKVSLVGDPGGDWTLWPLELAEVPR